MSKKIVTTSLELLVLLTFLVIDNFVEIDAFSFCLGTIYIMSFDIINTNDKS